MAKTKKTNAMRILDSENIGYKTYEYKADKDHLDGITVAKQIGLEVHRVYKTLVCQGHSRDHYVFVIPVAEELNLKKAAKAVAEKSVEMIRVADINKITGYIRGGCSPIGMKKNLKTVVDRSAEDLETIVVSAGKIGQQVEVDPRDLEKLIDVSFQDIVK